MIFRAFCLFLLLFGVATLKEGGAVLFFDPQAKIDAGNTVYFVLIFNFVAGFFYIITAILGLFRKPLAVKLAQLITIGSLVTWLGLMAHIGFGNPYETRTLVAHSLRVIIWILSSAYFMKRMPQEAIPIIS